MTETTPLTIIITEGDPAGIGPEIVLKATQQWQCPDDARLLVMGYPAHFLDVASADKMPAFTDWETACEQTGGGKIAWVHPGPEALNEPVELGKPSPRGGQAAARCIELAIEKCIQGKADAICTAPISKEGLQAAGYQFPGHTELLADRAEARHFAMMLIGGGLRVVLATIHEPLILVPDLLTKTRLLDLFHLVQRSMIQFGLETPRIGVAGLNPHAGEGGIFGEEEIEIIEPAIELARSAGIDVSGPWPADTLFHRMLEKEFDVVIAMYHDQGLIPIKTLDFHGGVNTTIGLPFVRTSPDHGTAYNLAGKGQANISSMIAALNEAYQQAGFRRQYEAETGMAHS